MSASTMNEIGIVLYPGAQPAAVYGLTDLFAIASKVALAHKRAGLSPLRVTHWQAAHGKGAPMSCVYDSNPGAQPRPRFLIVPPTMVNFPSPDVPADIAAWLRDQHAGGATLICVCSGAFLVAASGAMDGRAVSTHRICAEPLAKRFPRIVVDANRRIIDYGDIVTAGGFLAWVDVGLLLVERILGAAIGKEIAHFLVGDPVGRDARFFPPGYAPAQVHGDNAVHKAQEWVHMRDGRGVSLAAMAAAAGLERRTFLRRFAQATGMTPVEYSRAVRIARARELLESGNTAQKDIAQSLGYRDVASFARVFRRATGLAPGAYRKKFGHGATPGRDGRAGDEPEWQERLLERRVPAE